MKIMLLRFFFRHLATFLITGVVIAAGCEPENKTPDIPHGILDMRQMSLLMRDFALAESAAGMNLKNVMIHQNDSVYAFDPLYENNIRPSQYDSSLKFYSRYPALYQQVFDSALVLLSEIKAKGPAATAVQDPE